MCTTLIRELVNFKFFVYGTELYKTHVYEYLDEILLGKGVEKKIESVLRAIDTDPMRYSHSEKFKILEKDVWEIKLFKFRIACIWDKKPHSLIAIYGLTKKQDKWPSRKIETMREQLAAYRRDKERLIGGNNHGRDCEVSCK